MVPVKAAVNPPQGTQGFTGLTLISKRSYGSDEHVVKSTFIGLIFSHKFTPCNPVERPSGGRAVVSWLFPVKAHFTISRGVRT